MYKDELINLHQLLVYLMKFLIDNGASKRFFDDYTGLGICPHHIHRKKTEHRYAIFVLSHGISNVLSENDEIVPRGITKRFSELAHRCKSEVSRRKR